MTLLEQVSQQIDKEQAEKIQRLLGKLAKQQFNNKFKDKK
jgi:hypothetical protein